MEFNRGFCDCLDTVWASILALKDPHLAVAGVARN